MQSLGLFFKFLAKVQRAFKTAIAEIPPGDLKNKIKPLYLTRSVEKHNVFDNLSKLHYNLLS